MNPSPDKFLIESLSNPEAALRALDKFQSTNSLLNFMKLGWHTLEPEAPIVINYGLRAICDHLEAVTSGQIRRLLINVPPGFSKSMATNVFFPAWEWGPKNKPTYRYISFSHEQNLAVRDNVRCRDLIQSEWYQSLYGDVFSFKSDQNAKVYYENSKTGWRQACAASALTGRRGDRVIGDDPHSVKGADSDARREEVLQIFSETVPTRLNKASESAIIVIMQRVHEKDVSGLILASELGYEHLMLPMEFEPERRCYSTVKPSFIENPKAVECKFNKPKKVWVPVDEIESREEGKEIPDEYGEEVELRYNVDIRIEDGELLDPERFPKKAVEETKKALSSWGGSYAVAGQMQQRPAPRGGGMFKREDFNVIDSVNNLKGIVVRGWDLAGTKGKKSPFTVGAKLMYTQDKRVIILDIWRFQETPGGVESNIKKAAERDGKKTIIDLPQDPGQAGKSQVHSFTKLLAGYIIKHSPESGSKEFRAGPFAAQVEGGNVYLLRAEWNDQFLSEAELFPNGEFKDQIDACSRAYARLISKKGNRGIAAPQVLGNR